MLFCLSNVNQDYYRGILRCNYTKCVVHVFFLVRFSAASILKIREITRRLLFLEDNLPTVFADAAILTTKCTVQHGKDEGYIQANKTNNVHSLYFVLISLER